MYFDFLDDSMVRSSLTPTTSPTFEAVVWMEDFFKTYGDAVPNADEIRLPIMTKKDVFDKYEHHFKSIVPPLPTVDYSRFINLWNAQFPNARKRPWCEIPGKCDTCYRIDKLRKTADDSITLKKLQDAHLMHRGGMFMKQRKA